MQVGPTHMTIPNANGAKYFVCKFIVCPNKECARYTLTAQLFGSEWSGSHGRHLKTELEHEWLLVPQSKAKLLPAYIPQAIVQDYHEACMIVRASPKASATLARRCLQGLIRDFWNVKRNRLIDEIEAIKSEVDHSTWCAIDSVRTIGNIGAHMCKDIDQIIDVEPREAELLIGLIEMLIADWYVTRFERQQRMEQIKRMADAKDAQKTTSSLPDNA
jgi:hypothetical protein